MSVAVQKGVVQGLRVRQNERLQFHGKLSAIGE